MAPEPVNIVRNIYGHNVAGYCASVFSAHNCVGTGSAIRRNRCSNTAQIAGFAYPGEIYRGGNGAPVSGPPRAACIHRLCHHGDGQPASGCVAQHSRRH